MNDRELLEAAARAAGVNPQSVVGHPDCDGYAGVWNPLADDGDALRLAVKLRMSFDYRDDNTVNAQFIDHRQWSTEVQFEQCGGDPYAATRRAIVRAAALAAKHTETPQK